MAAIKLIDSLLSIVMQQHQQESLTSLKRKGICGDNVASRQRAEALVTQTTLDIIIHRMGTALTPQNAKKAMGMMTRHILRQVMQSSFALEKAQMQTLKQFTSQRVQQLVQPMLAEMAASTPDPMLLGVISSRKATWKRSDFSLESQGNIPSSSDYTQLWLIRHGERMDEVRTEESKSWRDGVSDDRLFDPPLTKLGFRQAQSRAQALQVAIARMVPLKCIYASPTERTMGTAVQIARLTGLSIVVVPGLCTCAAAVKKGGLVKRRAGDGSGFELFLENYKTIGVCRFLTKAEMRRKFGQDGVDIRFDYSHVGRFRGCVDKLVQTSKRREVVLCVTHREGIRKLDGRLKGTRVPYCAVAKYACLPPSGRSRDAFEFVYFQDIE